MDARYQVVERYYRQEHFDFYRAYRSPFYTVTFPLELTRLKAFAERHGYSVYANLCYGFTRAAAAIEDFRYRVRDGRVVLYERLHPALTVPAPGGRFSFSYIGWDPDVHAFNREARRVFAEAGSRVTLAESPHSNHLFFTALPGVPFTGFTHAESGDPTAGEPRVAFGRFARRDGRLEVPVGVQVNHAFIDGAALGALVEGAQRAFDDPESGRPETV
jgi:chloramphenicol O-acetyltransferase type A